jgi:hypothetical protein
MIENIINILKKHKQEWEDSNFRRALVKRDNWLIVKFNLEKFSTNEIEDTYKTWPFFKPKNSDLIWNRLYKKFYGFNPYFVNDSQLRYILRHFNPYEKIMYLQNKAMLDVYYSDIHFPKVYLKCINGILCDCNGNPTNKEKALSALEASGETSFFVKPSIDNGCGKGVKEITINDAIYEIKEGGDYVIQEKLKQCTFLNDLNETSINSCRVTSIYINGHFTCSSVLKVGKRGTYRDNWKYSYLVGMDSEGTLLGCGFDSNLETVNKADSNICFKGLKYPFYKEMTKEIERYHKKYFPYCGIIGWDVFIDSNNEVRVIEVNLDYPGVVGEQFCSGTFFQEHQKYIVQKICNI